MNTQQANRVKELLTKLNKTSCTRIDLPYYMNEDINSFEELRDYMEEQGAFDVDIIYYGNAIQYLMENDDSLTESLELASDMGYEAKNLNSEILASILASHNERIEFDELESKLAELFDEIANEEEEE